jgi:hypothetical protein
MGSISLPFTSRSRPMLMNGNNDNKMEKKLKYQICFFFESIFKQNKKHEIHVIN